MGDIISISDSLMITVFSMVVVFVVLIVISYLIDILRVTTNGKKGDEGINKVEPSVEQKKAETKEAIIEDNVDNEELIAVISAAVAASLGVSIPQINVKEIRRIPQTTTAWSDMGRREQILEKL